MGCVSRCLVARYRKHARAIYTLKVKKQDGTYMRFDSAHCERWPAAAVLTSGVVTRVQINKNMSQKGS